MAYTEVKMSRTKYNGKPEVSLTQDQFYLNTSFVKVAELQNGVRTRVFIDDEKKRIAFQFLRREDASTGYDVYKKSGKNGARYVSCLETYKKHKWLKKLSQMDNPSDRRFEVKEVSRDFWEAQLAPSFDISSARDDSASIPSDAIGIYRYIDEGKVVYIGEGQICRRLHRQERQEWFFDSIEYSLLKDKEECTFWEKYWLDKYVGDNDGTLPRYNRNSGYEVRDSNRLAALKSV